jgi:hypothetical protein
MLVVGSICALSVCIFSSVPSHCASNRERSTKRTSARHHQNDRLRIIRLDVEFPAGLFAHSPELARHDLRGRQSENINHERSTTKQMSALQIFLLLSGKSNGITSLFADINLPEPFAGM